MAVRHCGCCGELWDECIHEDGATDSYEEAFKRWDKDPDYYDQHQKEWQRANLR